MKQFVPDYYKQFRCIAGECRHTCCAGWEIDIDKHSMSRWQSLDQPLKDFIYDKIIMPEDGSMPHFMLCTDERCAFLNDEGLCEMILALGEDSLCQICSDHPRFRNFYSDRIEMGVGLCCEAVASLIINASGDFLLEETAEKLHPACQDDVDETIAETQSMTSDELSQLQQNESDIFQLRQALFTILQDRSRDINERLDEMLSFCEVSLPDMTLAQWADEFLSLDRLDAEWTPVLNQLKRLGEADFKAYKASVNVDIMDSPKWQKAFENLAIYFLYRHLPEALTDYDVLTKISFAVLSVRLLYVLCLSNAEQYGHVELAHLAEYARMYSTEVEYSLSNLGRIYDVLF